MAELIPVEENLAPFSVSSYLDYLNTLLTLQKVVIRGEIGDKINSYPKFTFFNLKDPTNSKAAIGCFVWNNTLQRLGMPLEEGMEIEVYGYAKIWPERGDLKFQVERVEVVGEGALKKLFEYLKQQLQSEGIFNDEYKTKIPKFARKIGLITSGQGRGAKKDFLTNLGDYGFDIHFYDVRVEGDSAVSDVVRALRYFNEKNRGYNALVLIRGGGNWESLRAFNSEDVARAIFASQIPVIVGIGHEDDTTIACMVADKRVSTPTAAAELLNESWKQVSTHLHYLERSMLSSLAAGYRQRVQQLNSVSGNVENALDRAYERYQRYLKQLLGGLELGFNGVLKTFAMTEKLFLQHESTLQNIITRDKALIAVLEQKLSRNVQVFDEMSARMITDFEKQLALANPVLKLKQGYSITVDEKSGKVIKRAEDLEKGSVLRTKFAEGFVVSEVQDVVSKKEI